MPERALKCPRHPHVRHESCPAREYPIIIRLDVGVGAVDEGYTPIEKIPEACDLRGRLAVKIHDDGIELSSLALESLQEGIYPKERIIDRIRQENSRKEIRDEYRPPVMLDDPIATSRHPIKPPFEEIKWADLYRVGRVHVWTDTVDICERVITASETVYTERAHLLGMLHLWADAVRDVFAVSDDTVGVVLFAQTRQMLTHKTTTVFTEYVAKNKDTDHDL